MDEERDESKQKKRFDEGERSIHREIPPAKDRLTDYKRKCFGRLFNGLAAARDNPDDRPASSTTSLA